MTPMAITPRYTDQVRSEGIMAYLVDCYERAQREEKYGSKVRSISSRSETGLEHEPISYICLLVVFLQSSERKALLALCREECISYSAIMLMDYFDPPDTPRHMAT